MSVEVQGGLFILGLLGALAIMSLPRLKKSISTDGLEHLKMVEGEKLTVYLDSAGHPTVGVGHKVLASDNLNVGDTISQARSTQLLRQDLRIAMEAVNNLVMVPLSQNQFDALTSFVFNVGVMNFRRSTLLSKLNQYDYQGALAEMERWNKITDPRTGEKVFSEGLANRRALEQNLFVA